MNKSESKVIGRTLLMIIVCRKASIPLIEAGVDIDFPVLYRYFALVSNIVQSAVGAIEMAIWKG